MYLPSNYSNVDRIQMFTFMWIWICNWVATNMRIQIYYALAWADNTGFTYFLSVPLDPQFKFQDL